MNSFLYKEETTEDEKIKVVLALPLFKNYIKYKKLQQNYMEDIFIPWYELTEQSKVAESVRCSSFFSFFSDRGPCKDCLYRKFHYDLIYWVEHSAFF